MRAGQALPQRPVAPSTLLLPDLRLLIALTLLLVDAPQPEAVRIRVQVVGVRAAKGGVMHVALHPAPGAGFPGAAPSPAGNQDAPVTAAELTVQFEAPPGTYAVAVHHDANANGRLDANLLELPREGYAVSNDVRPRFRPPRFGEARVVIQRDTTLVVHMVY